MTLITPRYLTFAIPIAWALSVPIARAADGTWDVDANGVWSDASNWTGNMVADGPGYTASFFDSLTADRTVTLDSSRTLTHLSFSDSVTFAGSWILTHSTLTLAGTTPTVTVGDLGINRTTTIASTLAGSDGLTKAGIGTLILSGLNTYTGPTTVTDGTLTIATRGTLGNGSYAGALNITTGSFNFASHADQTFSGTIDGFGDLTKTTGGGMLTISGTSNSLSGATTINAGSLNLTGTLGTSTITVNAGGVITGTGSTTGDIVLARTSGILLNASGSVQGANVFADPTIHLFVNETPTAAIVTRDVIRYTGLAPATESFDVAKYRSGAIHDTGTKITFAYQAEAKTWNTGGGDWDVNGTGSPWAGGSDAKFYWGDSVTLGGSASRNLLLKGLLAPASITVNNTAGTLTFSGTNGALVGSGGLAKSNAGTLSITGAGNTYKGATTVSGGTLSLRASADSQLASYVSPMSVGNGAILELNISNSVPVTNNVSAAITLTDGATLKHTATNGSSAYYVNLTSALTVSGNTSISAALAFTATSGNISGLLLDGGLRGSGTLTINGGNRAGNGVVFRDFTGSDGKSDFTGNIIVNGLANGNVDLGSGISVRGAQAALRNANLEVNGTMDLGGNTGDNASATAVSAMNWAQTGTGVVTIGALTGTGVVASNNGSSTLIIGNNDMGGTFSGTLVDGTATGAASLLNLTKIGNATETLTGIGSSYSGVTSINAGSLLIHGSKTGTGAVTVASTATLGGSGSVAGAVTVLSGGTLAPGASAGNLTCTSTVDVQSGSTYAAEIASASSHDKIIASGTLTINGSIKVILLGGYSPAANTVFDLADGSIEGTPNFDFTSATLPAGRIWDTSSFAANGSIKVISTDPFDVWATANNVTGGKWGDDDNDGVKNLMEFATAANPQSGSSGARVHPLVYPIGGQRVLTYTIAVRGGASFAANGSKQQADKDHVRYTVEASDQLDAWNSVVVTELAPADASAVQAALGVQLGSLDPAWQWHSFRTDGDVTSDPGDFIRLYVTEIP